MNKKGFTLVELIATIVIILLLGLIVTPKVMNVINENRIKGYKEIERRLEEAAGKYIIENYVDTSLSSVRIEKEKLIEGKYIDEIYDLKDKSVCDAYVIVSSLNNVVSFKSILNCSNYITSAVIKLDVILNQGTSSQEFASEYNTGEVITLETPTKLGYNFAGWELTSGNSKLNGNVLTIGNMDTIVSALWEEKEYVLTVNPNGGSLKQDFKEKYKTGEIINLNAPTREGYKFAGWEITSGSGIVSGNTFTMGTEDTVITAIWGIAQSIYTESDNTLTFIVSDHNYAVGETYDGKTITNVYTGFETTAYTAYSSIPWHSIRENVKNLVFVDTISPISTRYWFYEFKNCENFNVTKLDTSNVTDMYGMFSSAGYNATTWNIGDLSNWNTSNVTDMRSMFEYAGYNATTWNIGDLGNWDTSNVTNMRGMFFSAGSKATTFNIGNIGNWDTSNVKNMDSMFYSAASKATTWNIGDLSNWNTSNVTNMGNMFNSAGSKATTWNIGDLSGWNTSNVTNMRGMFYSAGYNATTFSIGNIGNWDTSNVTKMGNMFWDAGYKATTWNIGDLSGWNTSNVTNMRGMFYSAASKATTFNIGNIGNWDTSNVTDMALMFSSAGEYATNYNIGDLSNWNTEKVTDMSFMFTYAGYKATIFNIGDLSNWDTSNVTDMSNMFGGAAFNTTMFNIGDLGNWDVSKVINMSGMFINAGQNVTTFNIGNIGNWDTSNVTDMHDMFGYAGYKATTFNIGDPSHWDTSNVTNMSYMFVYAGSRATYSLNLSSWNVNKVTSYANFNEGVTSKVTAPTWVN